MESKVRLDKLLVEKGLFASREQARQAIIEGKILINGRPGNKAGQFVNTDVKISLLGDLLPYVSRAGLKLEHALEEFKINPQGRAVIDVGASTGGFTQVLLTKGAKLVYAVDVGHNQLHPSLLKDPRVISLEGKDIRKLTREDLPGVEESRPDLVVIDVSFISLSKVLPYIKRLLPSGVQIVALIKPQFEVGPDLVGKKGVIKDVRIRQLAIEGFKQTAEKNDIKTLGIIASPILGKQGNQEYLAYLTF
jgi:23S rRNA (cytidine1920-2'-O)/16S rRNA (cytidine1409-2'-O)-methyltransferase